MFETRIPVPSYESNLRRIFYRTLPTTIFPAFSHAATAPPASAATAGNVPFAPIARPFVSPGAIISIDSGVDHIA
jgi:hypothetical protein